MQIASLHSIVFTIQLGSTFLFACLFRLFALTSARVVICCAVIVTSIVVEVRVGIFAAPLFILGQKVLAQTLFSFLRGEHCFELADGLPNFGLIGCVVK